MSILPYSESPEKIFHFFILRKIFAEYESCIILEVFRFLSLISHQSVSFFHSLIFLFPFKEVSRLAECLVVRVESLIEVEFKHILVLKFLSLWLAEILIDVIFDFILSVELTGLVWM